MAEESKKKKDIESRVKKADEPIENKKKSIDSESDTEVKESPAKLAYGIEVQKPEEKPEEKAVAEAPLIQEEKPEKKPELRIVEEQPEEKKPEIIPERKEEQTASLPSQEVKSPEVIKDSQFWENEIAKKQVKAQEAVSSYIDSVDEENNFRQNQMKIIEEDMRTIRERRDQTWEKFNNPIKRKSFFVKGDHFRNILVALIYTGSGGDILDKEIDRQYQKDMNDKNEAWKMYNALSNEYKSERVAYMQYRADYFSSIKDAMSVQMQYDDKIMKDAQWVQTLKNTEEQNRRANEQLEITKQQLARQESQQNFSNNLAVLQEQRKVRQEITQNRLTELKIEKANLEIEKLKNPLASGIALTTIKGEDGKEIQIGSSIDPEEKHKEKANVINAFENAVSGRKRDIQLIKSLGELKLDNQASITNRMKNKWKKFKAKYKGEKDPKRLQILVLNDILKDFFGPTKTQLDLGKMSDVDLKLVTDTVGLVVDSEGEINFDKLTPEMLHVTAQRVSSLMNQKYNKAYADIGMTINGHRASKEQFFQVLDNQAGLNEQPKKGEFRPPEVKGNKSLQKKVNSIKSEKEEKLSKSLGGA